MFYFSKLHVYQKAKAFNVYVIDFLAGETSPPIDFQTKALSQAALDIMTSLAKADAHPPKSHERMEHYLEAKFAVFRCMALVDLMDALGLISEDALLNMMSEGEAMIKMTHGLIKSKGKSEAAEEEVQEPAES